MKIFIASIFALFIGLGAYAQVKVITNGNVGIGVDVPTNKLQSNGLAADFINDSHLRLGVFASDPRIQSSTDKIVFYDMANTDYVAIHVSNVITSSDERLKTNIKAINGNALDIVRRLKPVTYNWISGKDKQLHAGFLAQEVEAVLPNLVTKDDSVGVKGVAYQEFIPYLVEAIKEQQAIIERLETKLADLGSAVRKEEE